MYYKDAKDGYDSDYGVDYIEAPRPLPISTGSRPSPFAVRPKLGYNFSADDAWTWIKTPTGMVVTGLSVAALAFLVWYFFIKSDEGSSVGQGRGSISKPTPSMSSGKSFSYY